MTQDLHQGGEEGGKEGRGCLIVWCPEGGQEEEATWQRVAGTEIGRDREKEMHSHKGNERDRAARRKTGRERHRQTDPEPEGDREGKTEGCTERDMYTDRQRRQRDTDT